MPQLLDLSFYQSGDVVALSRKLLGCRIVTDIGGEKTEGLIVETEAYKAPHDKASHAWNNRRTARTETMFQKGGVAYVYLCYGIHHLFNVVTGAEGLAHAILIRAIKPQGNIAPMLRRRGFHKISPKLTDGPGKWTQAMGITTSLDRMPLYDTTSPVRIYQGVNIPDQKIITGPRVGIDYAEEWASVPWRFRVMPEAFE